MKALVYHGSGNKQLEEMPKPMLRDATDAVVRMVKMTICGTDLHILKGDLPTIEAGRIPGHEGIGVIEAAGMDATLAFARKSSGLVDTSPTSAGMARA